MMTALKDEVAGWIYSVCRTTKHTELFPWDTSLLVNTEQLLLEERANARPTPSVQNALLKMARLARQTRPAEMKLAIAVVVLMCAGVAHTQDVMSPTLDILGELQKIKTMLEKINALQDEVRELRRKNEESVTVAFSASLSESLGARHIGPYPQATTLVYENAFINIGNAYDTSTGIFTAPVKGVYFFIFVVFNPYDMATGARFIHNDRFVVAASDNPPGADTEDTTCNSVTLLLEKGDRVHLQLIEKRRIFTDYWKRSTFSGHLLFTV